MLPLTAAGPRDARAPDETGEQRLADLLEGWRPEEHADLARMIAVLAREFFVDTVGARRTPPAPRRAAAAA